MFGRPRPEVPGRPRNSRRGRRIESIGQLRDRMKNEIVNAAAEERWEDVGRLSIEMSRGLVTKGMKSTSAAKIVEHLDPSFLERRSRMYREAQTKEDRRQIRELTKGELILRGHTRKDAEIILKRIESEK